MNKKQGMTKFEQGIQSRLTDDQWDGYIATQVIQMRQEQSRRKIQFAILPMVILTASAIYFTAIPSRESNRLAAQKKTPRNNYPSRQFEGQRKKPLPGYENHKNQDYIIETVFTHFK